MPIADRHDEYAFAVAAQLRVAGLRTEAVTSHAGALGARIRKAKLEKVPYVLVVGDEDVEGATVGVNARGSEQPERGVLVADFQARVLSEVAAKCR